MHIYLGAALILPLTNIKGDQITEKKSSNDICIQDRESSIRSKSILIKLLRSVENFVQRTAFFIKKNAKLEDQSTYRHAASQVKKKERNNRAAF